MKSATLVVLILEACLCIATAHPLYGKRESQRPPPLGYLLPQILNGEKREALPLGSRAGLANHQSEPVGQGKSSNGKEKGS